MNRRTFLAHGAAGIAGLGLAKALPATTPRTQVLYNGIRLASPWPPRARSLSLEPMAVPYLQGPPAIIPIDVGRQLFVDDFLVAGMTTLTRTYHLAKYYANNPVFSGGMVFSDGAWYDPKDHLFKLWYFDHGTGYTPSKDG